MERSKPELGQLVNHQRDGIVAEFPEFPHLVLHLWQGERKYCLVTAQQSSSAPRNGRGQDILLRTLSIRRHLSFHRHLGFQIHLRLLTGQEISDGSNSSRVNRGRVAGSLLTGRAGGLLSGRYSRV